MHDLPGLDQQTTRARLIRMLRNRPATVEDLATALDLTGGAVRNHLGDLQRLGLVDVVGEVKGPRRPSALYGISRLGEESLSRAYVPLVAALVSELEEALKPDDWHTVLGRIGERLAGGVRRQPETGEAWRGRLAEAVERLEALGGLCEIDHASDPVAIQGHGCPVGSLTESHPAVCHAMEALVSAILGTEVRERCERAPRPRCRFVVANQPPLVR